jgi:hypothetical protein
VSADERRRDAILLPTMLVLFGAISVAVGADANWDLRNYHYYNGYAAWTGRLTFDYGAAQVQTYINPFLDVPFFLLVQALPPVAVGFILGALHGINAWLVFRIALHVLRPRTERCRELALGFTAVAMGGSAALSQLGTTFHDLTITPLILGSLLLLVRWSAETPGSVGAAIAAGALIGMGVGLKYTFAVYAPGAAVVVMLLAPPGWRRRLLVTAMWGAGVGMGFAAAAGPWMLHLWRAFGTPTAQYLNDVFRSPYFEPWNFEDHRFLPKTALQTVAYPLYFFLSRVPVAGEARFREARFAVLYVLIVAVVVKVLLERRSARRAAELTGATPTAWARVDVALLAFMVVSYVMWQKKFSIYRYLIPLELLAPLVIYLLVCFLVPSQRRRVLVTAILLAAIVLGMRTPTWGRRDWGRDFFGTSVRPGAVPSTSLILVATYEPLAFVAPALPPEARIVRVQSNFFEPTATTMLAKEIRTIITEHRGPLRLLSHRRHRALAQRAVGAYGFHIVTDRCEPVTNRMDPDIEVCVLENG